MSNGIQIIRPITEIRELRLNKDRCVFCGEVLGDFATYPCNRQGSFSHWFHVACVERAARWFADNSYLIDWKTLQVLDRFNKQAINGAGLK